MQALLIVVGSLVLIGAIMKAISWLQRSRLTRGIPEDAIQRQLRGTSMRVLTQGPPVFPGMSSRKANRTIGDLVLLNDRMLLVCNRGTLLDIREDRGRKLSSARCTGPGRLVLEGQIAVPSGIAGQYRIELSAEDAPAWAKALAPFVDADAEAFASWEGVRKSG